jgi:hypothetical protein
MNTLLLLPIHKLPFWAMFAIMIVLVLAAVRIGFRLGRHRSKQSEGAPEGPVGAVVGAVMGLVAFMLAFTFSISAGHFDTRKQLLLDDVNVIGTTALRARLLPEPQRSACLKLLKRYVDIRLTVSTSEEVRQQVLIESKSLQIDLWSNAVELARADMNSDIGALFVESLNEMIDLHNTRATVALQYRIPPVIWLVLISLTMLGMAGVGFQFGLAGRSSFLMHAIMAISFALVVTLIAELDKPTGMLRLSHKPMLELQADLAK